VPLLGLLELPLPELFKTLLPKVLLGPLRVLSLKRPKGLRVLLSPLGALVWPPGLPAVTSLSSPLLIPLAAQASRSDTLARVTLEESIRQGALGGSAQAAGPVRASAATIIALNPLKLIIFIFLGNWFVFSLCL
jgi:hypothetical protein